MVAELEYVVYCWGQLAPSAAYKALECVGRPGIGSTVATASMIAI